MTSLTFQNAAGVFGATHETGRSLRAQIVPVLQEQEIAAVKIGMLPTAELISEVATLVRENRLPAPVVDPVLRSSSGYELMESDAVEVFVRELLPLARLVTPNIPEAESLTDVEICDEQDMRRAAAKLREMAARAVLIKGGHAKPKAEGRRQNASGREAIDLLDDEGELAILRGEWIDAPSVRGTGCMLSSAIAASLAKGADLLTAVNAAKKYVATEIQNSKLISTRR